MHSDEFYAPRFFLQHGGGGLLPKLTQSKMDAQISITELLLILRNIKKTIKKRDGSLASSAMIFSMISMWINQLCFMFRANLANVTVSTCYI